MSETAAASPRRREPHARGAPARATRAVGSGSSAARIFSAEQREAAVFVVAVLLFVYFGVTTANFFTKLNLANIS